MCVWLAASPSTYHPKESPLAALQVNVAVVLIAAATDSGVAIIMESKEKKQQKLVEKDITSMMYVYLGHAQLQRFGFQI